MYMDLTIQDYNEKEIQLLSELRDMFEKEAHIVDTIWRYWIEERRIEYEQQTRAE